MDGDIKTVLLIVTNAVIGTTRTIEGLAALRIIPSVSEVHARRLKMGMQIACGILQLAAAALLVRHASH